jgi:aryl-alcohol dehydrogenase-like predicted oxidoreductase
MITKRGLNHFDCAASYGDAELRLAPYLQDHRNDVFLATKTGDRTRDLAWKSIENSLERMQVDQIDLIQLHNLTHDEDWDVAMGEQGALKAAIEAKEQGLVKFIGVTGHGTRTAEMHLRSLGSFEFDSVLLPYSYASLLDERYEKEFETLYALSKEKGFAIQTIKSIAKRRWRDEDPSPKFSWYEPLRDKDAIARAVQLVFSRPGLFLNSSSDATLLPLILDAAEQCTNEEMGLAERNNLLSEIAKDVAANDIEPLFTRGVQDDVL